MKKKTKNVDLRATRVNLRCDCVWNGVSSFSFWFSGITSEGNRSIATKAVSGETKEQA